MLSGANGSSPWAENPAEGAGNLLECALGSYTSGLLSGWQMPVEFDAKGAANRVPDEPDVWTDGNLVQDRFNIRKTPNRNARCVPSTALPQKQSTSKMFPWAWT